MSLTPSTVGTLSRALHGVSGSAGLIEKSGYIVRVKGRLCALRPFR